MFKGSKKHPDKSFIFQDHSGRRWPAVWSISLLVIIFLSIVVSVIGASLVHNPDVPPLDLDETQKVIPINEPISAPAEDFPKLNFDKQKAAAQIGKNEIYGFYTAGDDLSKKSLKKNIDSLGVLIPNWFYLESDKAFNKASEKSTEDFAKKHHVKIMPRFYLNDGSDAELLHQMLISKNSRPEMINSLYQQIKKGQYAGINIDFRGINEGDKELFTAFMSELYPLFHANNLQVTLSVDLNNEAYDYAALSKQTDRVIVMYFDEHHELTDSGPVASLNWSQQTLQQLPVPAEKEIVCLGNYGYTWKLNSTDSGTYMDFNQIMDSAAESKLQTYWDQVSRTPYIRYTKNNEQYITWFLDAATTYNQLKLALEHGVKGAAVQQLGYEDPGIWKFISNTGKMDDNIEKIQKMDNPAPIVGIGSGEFIKVTSNSHKGSRNIQVDENGLISSERYEKYPIPYYVKRFGYTDKKEVAITFDDGPDPAYTPEILNILSKKHVPATFFVIGKHAALYPNIIQRAAKEGHEIGNHTFSHADIKKDNQLELQMEMNSTQRLIQEATGRTATMFRPPFTTDAEYDLEDLRPIIKTQEMGYTMVGSFIDTRDWETQSSDTIVKRAIDGLSRGNIILLHDSGGNRSATIAALPRIIDELHKRGYKFVPAAQLAGKTPAEAMPPVREGSGTYMAFYKIADTLVIIFTKLCLIFFTAGIAFGIFRMLFLLYFSYKHKRNDGKRKKNPDFKPIISVIIPAYNEEKVIENTIHSILKSDYPHFEIIVVDDGSTDKTGAVVSNTFANHAKVRLLTQPNGGKSSAINKGFLKAEGEIIVVLDADTSIAENSISLLVGHFADERVAAVSGNVKIGNLRNLLTLWQHVEYVTGFNLEKRSFSELNCITVVPGAIGAWRKSVVSEVGYFSNDTLAEDTDITLKILRKGHRVTAEPKAFAYTEAPETLKAFMKQRFRWSYGILQCLWKHRGALFNKKQKTLGFIALPNMWAQYVFLSLAPLADLLFIIGLFGDTPKIVTYYLAFLLVDLIVSFYALRLEKVSIKPLLLLIVQRFVYRQLLTYTVWKAFTTAAKGVIVGWNKLHRSGNVTVPVKNLEKGV